MSTQYRYYVWVKPYGGVASAAIVTRAQAAFELGATVKNYQDNGREVKDTGLVTFCAECGGSGKVLKCKSKAPSWKHAHKASCYRSCPDCHGRNSETTETGMPSEALAGMNAQTKELSDNGWLAEYKVSA